MPRCLDPAFAILPPAQREIWEWLSAAPRLSFVLYGGTAIALQLGHRQSVDFDFFRSEPLDKGRIRSEFGFVHGAIVLQDSPDTLVVLADMPSGSVKVSFFGHIDIGRIEDPLPTCDGTLLVASLQDLMATKLKTILDRAEAKDYRDIACLIRAGVSLPIGLSAFQQMYEGEPAQVLRALGYYEDGDLGSLSEQDREVLRAARDQVDELPRVMLRRGMLSIPLGDCGD